MNCTNSSWRNCTSNGTSDTTRNGRITQESTLVAVILVFVMLLSLCGNGLVLVAFCRFHRLRVVTNYFIVALSCADILVTVFSIPYWLFHRIQELNGSYDHFWTVGYYAWQLVDILCCTASIINLCLISIDRYIAVSSPLTYYTIMTARRARLSIVAAWVYAIICSSLSLIVALVDKAQRATTGRIFAVFISFAAFFVPLIVLLSIYGTILCTALTHVRRINIRDAIVNHGLERERRTRFAGELKVTKTLALVVGGFLICWGPFFTLVMLYAVCRDCSHFAFEVNASYWLKYLNSIVNPVVYAVFNMNFRQAFLKLLIGRRAHNRWRETTAVAGKSAHVSILRKVTLSRARAVAPVNGHTGTQVS